jgi:hypothetical protein
MAKQLLSNFDHQDLFENKYVTNCCLHTRNFLPLEQFIGCIIPLRVSHGPVAPIWNMALISAVESLTSDQAHACPVITSLLVTTFKRQSQQRFDLLRHGRHFLRQNFEEDFDETDFENEPYLHIWMSDLLRAKEIQQQSIMTWIMSGRFAHLLIPRRDMQFRKSVTRAANAKKRKFQELQETSVYKWVAHPLMDRNLIWLVLSFVR